MIEFRDVSHYRLVTRPAVRECFPFFQGFIIDIFTRDVIYYSEMLSREYISHNLNCKLKKLLREGEDKLE